MYSQASLNLETDSLAQLPEGGMTALGGACDPCQVKSPCCSGHHNARESRRPADDPGGLSSRACPTGWSAACPTRIDHLKCSMPYRMDRLKYSMPYRMDRPKLLATDCSNRMLQIKQLEAEMHALETLKLEVHRGSCAWDFTASEA
ncbi:uncharacterized protein LOC143272446 isoform X2 [Peromyscus maniculatus bairdii]|uniref:uncharacterized protein LOC143272446 isoform X2 n=1 Tax=Peromyscus maniculatus bairdii TaxID=230844 RepID=UPI003FD3A4C3